MTDADRGEVRALVDAVADYAAALEVDNDFRTARSKFHKMRKQGIKVGRMLDVIERTNVVDDDAEPHDAAPPEEATE